MPSEPPNFGDDAVFNAAPANYLLLDPGLRIAAVTDAYLAVTMTERKSLIGQGIFDAFPDNPNDPAADGVRNLRASLARVLETKRPDRMAIQRYDIRRPEAEGGGFEERYWSPLNTPVLSEDGGLRYIIHWVDDVTELVRLRREIEREREPLREALPGRRSDEERGSFLRSEVVEVSKELGEAERRFRFVTNALPQLIWAASADGRFEYGNDRWQNVTGFARDQLVGHGWLDLVHSADRPRTLVKWREAVQAGAESFQIEHRLRQRSGGYRWMLTLARPYRDATGTIRRWFGSTTDIHERMEAEEKLRQAQRMQAVGKLAGGVAHEVNNMMTAVTGFGELVLAALEEDNPARADVDEMIKAGMRSAHISRQLLAFSRQQLLTPTVLDVNTVVNELLPMLRRVIGSDRRLEARLSPTPVSVLVDRVQLEQVLINLVANARDATTTNSRVTVDVSLVDAAAAVAAAADHTGAADGQWARIVVRDDGVGMPADVLSRVFEPFFTTKAVGHGTGLGLSMVHGIVHQSGGSVNIDSKPGTGTTVTIFLPQVDADVTPDRPTTGTRGRGERILVAEDEPAVRTLATRGLEQAGYVVHAAADGAEALEYLDAHRGMVDLVLTDIVMPRVNGRQLAERIAERHADVPVLFMSGYSGDEITQRGFMLAGVPIIHKPFTLDALASAVRARLDAVRQPVGHFDLL